MPAPLAIGAVSGLASLLGGLLGKGQNPTIDPALLAKLFGPQALSGDTQQLYRMLANSPIFSQMMNSQAMRGSNLANQMQGNLAASGRSATPYGGFLKAAGRGYGATLQRQGQSDLFMQALQQAAQNLQTRAGIWGQSQLQRQNDPTWGRMIGSSLLGAGAAGFGNMWGK